MAMKTAPSAIAVVRPAISIMRRTRAIRTACSGLCWGNSVVSVMPDSIAHSAQKLEVVVAGDEGSARLDRVLAQRLPELSRSRLKALIQAGQVQISQVQISQVRTSQVEMSPVQTSQVAAKAAPIRDPAYHVARGDTIIIDVPEAADPAPKGENIALDIVYEDGDIIVIDKPAGLVVHPAAGHETGTLVNALIAHCGASLSGIGGVRRPGIVHRLDKDTSGLMVIAKNDLAHHQLSAQFAEHGRTGDMERGYLTVAWGVPRHLKGTIDAPIDRHPHAREKMAVREGGREAVTHYEVRASFAAPDGKPVASLIACRLETGRTHQIRVHLAHIGHPLLGDSVYGAGFKSKAAQLPEAARAALAQLARQALHAAILGFVHPITGETLSFESPPRGDFDKLINALKARSA